MIKQYLHWTAATLIGGLVLPFVVIVCSFAMTSILPLWTLVLMSILTAIAGFLGTKALQKWFGQRLAPVMEKEASAHSNFLDKLDKKQVIIAITISAALSLFMELSMIRWQASAFEFFAFYKNFGLLACLAGLGTGYALAGLPGLPLICTVPLLGFQFLVLLLMRHGLDNCLIRSLIATPITEQASMGLDPEVTVPEFIAVYSMLAFTFILTVLAFIPIGQLCGRLMSKERPLSAYGFNLIGSLLGIISITALSYWSTPPAVWFAIAFVVITAFCAANRKSLLMAASSSIIALAILSWPFNIGSEVVFSPYQVLERGPGKHGWSEIRAAGQYYQRMLDLSPAARTAYKDIAHQAVYYDLPYLVNPHPKSVAVLGAGSGNDVAAALRSGALKVDAIEIDPAILAFGRWYHPEKPYSDARVTPIVADARTYLRNTDRNYDMIVFGLLDSHSLVSHASSLRLDSYVYTVESFKEARARLSPGGILSLSFSTNTPAMARKIYLMLEQAFEKPPICLLRLKSYDGSSTFLQNKEGDLSLSSEVLQKAGLVDATTVVAQAKGMPVEEAKKMMAVDPSTDDWPFFYMPRRIWPVSYIPMILLIIGATYGISKGLGRQGVSLNGMDFFLLGTGFMLLEAKAITELGLVFGNTWYVIAIVIASIIFMAYCANLLVERAPFIKAGTAYVLLILSLAGGLYVTFLGGFSSDVAGKISAILLLTCPLAFSGIVFSSLVARCKNLPRAMSMNLLGAMLGGVLEYSSMYLGYRALYVVAIVIYLLAYACSWARGSGNAEIRG